MIILITGATHTGKTNLAQKLLERFSFPYFSIDHLKMGLIRSGSIPLTAEDDEKLIKVLWPIVKEMIKTAIENKQNLIIEGGYIPPTWDKDFEKEYLENIKCFCLIMSPNYIEKKFDDIIKFENIIETRVESSAYTKAFLLEDNKRYLSFKDNKNVHMIYIDTEYDVDIDL